MLEWEWYDDLYMFRLFMHLLFKANNRDKEWHGTIIKRGQLVTSLANLSAETRLSYQQVRSCLDKLNKTGEINKQTTNKFTIITVCKYGKYQQSPADEQQAINKQTTNKQQTNNNQSTTTIEYKNNRKKEIIKTSTNVDAKKPSFVEPAFEESFSAWLEYKHQRRESYKSDMSLKACYNKLVKLAGGDPSVAMAIVEQSMANNWAGLFPLKKDNDNGDNSQRKAPVAGPVPGRPQGKDPLVGYEKVIKA
jgi:hypothetical protein